MPKKSSPRAPAKPRKTATVRKTTPRKPAAPKETEAPAQVKAAKHVYVYAVGRRKTAVARVRLHKKGGGEFIVNGKALQEYFPTHMLQTTVQQPMLVTGMQPGMISVKVVGGGMHSQAESVRHGIARALLLLDPAARSALKHAGLLTRDARVKERKKYGLKRARRAPQWQKR